MLVTIYADNDGYVEGSNATYATARTTAATAYEDMAPAVGQQLSGGTYKCFESFLSFPLSSLGDYGADEYELLSASIFLQVSADGAATDFTINAMKDDWGTSLTTGDWHNGSTALTEETLWSADSADAVSGEYLELAWAPVGVGPVNIRNKLSSSPVMPTASEHLRLLLYSDRHKAGTTPSGNEYLSFYSAATAGTTDDPYMLVDYVYYEVSAATDDLAGAVGPAVAFNRELSAAEVAAVMTLGQTIMDRALDNGTVTIGGEVRTAAGTVVPATHVRAGWWLQDLDYLPDASEGPRPLVIGAHDVDLAAGTNALTIGQDWMLREIGVRMGELLALPEPVALSADEEAVLDPTLPDAVDTVEEPEWTEPALGESIPYVQGSVPPGPGWSYDPATNSWVLIDDSGFDHTIKKDKTPTEDHKPPTYWEIW